MLKQTYREVVHDLKEKIGGGIYAPGDKLPSARDLVKIYGVSTHMAERALRELEQQKLIVRRPRIGTFVNDEEQ